MNADPPVLVAAANLITSGSDILLVREAKPAARQRFNLPAGKVEAGETIPEAAAREAREETGLDVEVVSLVGIYHCPATSEGTAVVNFVFESRPRGGEIGVSAAHPEVRFVPIAELEAMAAQRRLRGTHILRAVQALAAGRRLPLDVVEVVPASPFAPRP